MMKEETIRTGYPSIDKPWLKYYSEEAITAELPEESLYEYIYNCNKNHLQHTALNYFGKKMSFAELFKNINIVANGLMAQGVKEGDVVTVVSLSTVNSVLCFYAINRIGAVANYINVLSSVEDMKKYFLEADSKVVISLDLFGKNVLEAIEDTLVQKVIIFSLADWMPTLTRLIFLQEMKKVDFTYKTNKRIVEWKDFISRASNTKIEYKKNSKEICFMGHTGGTTGFPKSVLLSDYAMNAVAHQYNLCMEHKVGEVFLNCIVPFVVYGSLTCLHMPLSLGLEVVLVPKFEATDWKTYLSKYKPNHIAGIPSYVEPMLHDKRLVKYNFACLKTLAVGGDGMNEKLEMQLNAFLQEHHSTVKITKGYGMTEVCATAATEYNYCNSIGSVGIPLVKNNFQIYDNEYSKELKYNEVGEICINSPSLMIGYKGNESETNNLIKTHSDGKEWVHTGDLGKITEDGHIIIVGRMKRMIFLGPEGMLYKVFPKTIEDTISKLTEVENVCVVSKTTDRGLSAMAYVVLNTEIKDCDAEVKIKAICKESLPEYMIPEYVVCLDRMPLTDIGKVDYKYLEKITNLKS